MAPPFAHTSLLRVAVVIAVVAVDSFDLTFDVVDAVGRMTDGSDGFDAAVAVLPPLEFVVLVPDVVLCPCLCVKMLSWGLFREIL